MALICFLLLAFFLSAMATASAPNFSSSESKPGRLLPMVINTWNFPEANIKAWRILSLSKSGLWQTRNAVVEGISECERLQCGKAVGYGGSPDEQGGTSLDAMIMDGRTMKVGAVANLRRIKSAIKVARHVLEHTKHSLLVGNAAEDFANEMGFQNESLVTPESAQNWTQWRAKRCQPNFRINVHPDPKASCGPYSPVTPWEEDDRTQSDYEIGPGNHDTITMIAIDEESNIHAGSSTNGLEYSIPGRVGDAAIPGAGAYADNEVGAAVTTGNGDVMMRFLPSFFAVEAMRTGKTPREAATLALSRIRRHYPNFNGAIVAVNRLGEYSVTCHGLTGKFSFIISSPALPDRPTRKETVKCTKGSDQEDVPFNYIT